MFEDKFIGGPLDGERRPSTGDTIDGDPIIHDASGARYERDDKASSSEVSVWRYVTAEEVFTQKAVSALQVRVRNPDGVTLAELEDFVQRARAAGYRDESKLKVWVKMRGHVREMTVQRPQK